LIEGNEIERAGIRVPSVVKCESLLTVNKSMIVKFLGTLSDEGTGKVNECLRDALGID
jgi:mRNA interferase MazF